MKVGLIKDHKLSEETPILDVKFTHSLCIGQTGSGKTTSFIYPNLLERMELNHGILFFDIKGNEHLAVKTLAKEAGRLEDVIEIGKPWGENINILKEMNERNVADLLKALMKVGKEGGSNAYFYNAAQTLGLSLYGIFRVCEILIQEFKEVGYEISFLDKKEFSLEDIYKVILDMEDLYQFLSKLEDFIKDVKNAIDKNSYLYFEKDKKSLFKNLILNLQTLEKLFDKLKPYYVEKDDRSDRGKFDQALTSVISTLVDSFSFMVSASSKYIASSSNTINIVDALQDNKIVIINVRVIPDTILEILLGQVFEQLIDLNIKDENDRHPTSIFIDEAQRLINKEIPLDVLRSSKVDVVMAVQNELQLISKFGSKDDWQQIAINIAQKYAFKSSMYGDGSVFYPDIGEFDTFVYTKEYDNKIYKAIPTFINKDESIQIEYEYQHEILKLNDLEENKYFIYDVTHYEREREVVVKDIVTNKKYHKKVFNDIEDLIIEKYIKNELSDMYVSFIRKNLNENISLNSWKNLIGIGIINKEIYDEAYYGIFEEEKAESIEKKLYKEKRNPVKVYEWESKKDLIFIKLSDERLKELGFDKEYVENMLNNKFDEKVDDYTSDEMPF